MPFRPPARAAVLFLALAAVPIEAQEPEPAKIRASNVFFSEGVGLTLAWRYAPGDAPGREAPAVDDGGWLYLKPGMAVGELPPGGWPGVGWFRRHLLVDPAVQKRPVALRLEAPGTAEVFLDGRPVLSLGQGTATPEVPWGRREASLVSFEGHRHLLAVRYVYPAGSARPAEGIGFRLSLGDPARAAPGRERPWMAAVQGASVALPLFLAFLHVAFFAFDPRQRGNLYFAGLLAVFALLLLQEFATSLLATDAQRNVLGLITQGAPVAAIIFGTLTYYVVRTNRFPRTARAFVAAGLVLLPLTYVSRPALEYGWQLYFVALTAEIVRLEWSGRTLRRQRADFFVASFVVFAIAILLQILANNDLIPGIAGFRSYYVVGILALSVGMSLSLANEVSRSRVVEAENERKTRELAQARELQLSMLPRALPSVRGLDLAAATHTAAEVGGDYYDLRACGDGGLLVAFGDATGHGLASGIVVTAAKALFTSLPADGPLTGLLAGCDEVLRGMRLPGLQMCLALARVAPCEVAVASAAMPPLLVHRLRTGEVEELGAGGLPLGGRIPLRYEERRTDLAPGDTVLFASDGFAELLDPQGCELGYGGAAEAFREAARGASAGDVVARLGAAAAGFRGPRPQDDDITFVVVRVAGCSRDE